jgi:cytochrome P450
MSVAKVSCFGKIELNFIGTILGYGKANRGPYLGRNERHNHASHSTFFKEIQDGDLPPEEKTITRMQLESQGVVGAGIHTVKWTVSVATVCFLSNPAILQQLKQELIEAWREENPPPKLEGLEKVPYLTAVIRECQFC